VSTRAPRVEELHEQGPLAEVEAWLRVHHVEIAFDEVMARDRALFEVAKSRTVQSANQDSPADHKGPHEPSLDDAKSQLTVIEVAVPLRAPGRDPPRDEVDYTEEFDVALACVRHLQRSVAVILQDAIPLVTQRTCPVAVPAAEGLLSRTGEDPPSPTLPLCST
jgi:hypothetical protein